MRAEPREIKTNEGIKRTCWQHGSLPKDAKNIRFVREAGGLGDALRVMAIGYGLKKKYPQSRIHYYGPDYLGNLISNRGSKCFDLYFPCECRSRGRDVLINETQHKHLARGIKYDITIDAWCPPYLHEPATKGLVIFDRTEIWCMHAGVEPNRPYLDVLEEDLRQKNLFLLNKTKKIIGIQAGATCRSREYPYRHWAKLIELLYDEGFHVIVFDVCYRGFEQLPLKKFEPSINLPWSATIGRVLACDLLVTPDSGFYHLAGMLGKKCLGLFGCMNGQIISRPWRIGEVTGEYEQLAQDEIDFSKLPNGCNPKCAMRWERGWRGERYRKQGFYCELLEQLMPERVFERIKNLI